MPSKDEKVRRKGRRKHAEADCGDDIVPKNSTSHSKLPTDGNAKVEKFSPTKKSKDIVEDATGVLFKDSFKSVLTTLSNQTPYSYRNSVFRTVNNFGLTKPIFTCGSMVHDRITSAQKFEVVGSSIVKNLTFFNAFKPFPNRITCIRWVPRKSSALLIGGKGGELSYIPDVDQQAFLDDQMDENCVVLSTGLGPGGEIREMCVNELDNKYFYSLNVSGELLKFDIERGEASVLQPLNHLNCWYAGLNVHHKKKLIFMGDDTGQIHIMPDTSRGQEGKRRIMKCHARGKVSHIEFHPGNENLMTTCGSGDHCVKIWDIRMLKEFDQLHELPHVKAPNSCYFNHDGSMVLTTDQGKELRVYSTVNWKLINSILHPHRQFQHLTPIRAEWHPLADIISVGRYPDENFLKGDKKTIDFFDYRTGEAFHRLACKNDKIGLLNRFNDGGDILASMQQSSILIYRRAGHAVSSKVKKERKMSDDEDGGEGNDDPKKGNKLKFVDRRARGKKKPPTKKELSLQLLEEDDQIAKEKSAARAMMASRCSRMKASTKRKPVRKALPEGSEDSEEDLKPAKSTKTPSTKRRPKKDSTSEESEEERKPARKAKASQASLSAKRNLKREPTPTESEDSEEERKPARKAKTSSTKRRPKKASSEESEEDLKPTKSKKKRPRT
ncbi:DNA damage-binding protein 2-like [Brevipalpus obovatus]|uniref:DNA damage-binding protein 2-like n=1 Tax=Brevipalpus obovatus TaxID=246614 RepID=UPI003D9E2DC7